MNRLAAHLDALKAVPVPVTLPNGRQEFSSLAQVKSTSDAMQLLYKAHQCGGFSRRCHPLASKEEVAKRARRADLLKAICLLCGCSETKVEQLLGRLGEGAIDGVRKEVEHLMTSRA